MGESLYLFIDGMHILQDYLMIEVIKYLVLSLVTELSLFHVLML